MSTQHSPTHPGSGYASPAGSVLLPPIEIEVSPAHSYRSSSSSFRRHYSDDSSSDESDNKSRDPPQRRPTMASSSSTATATTVQASNMRTSNIFTNTFAAEASSSVMSFTRKGKMEDYENNSHLYGQGMLQRIGITGTAILTPILGELSAVVRTTGSGDGFARAYAMFNMAFSIGVLVGPVICGIVYERLGFRAITCVMAGSLFIATPVVLLWIGGAEQKKRDLIKYKEDEAFRRSQIPRSKYSLEFSASGVSASTEELGLVGLDGEKQTQVLSRPISRDDILKFARMD
ncbi:hypothetical protein BGZ52_001858 [Haplosporangium bisporale]|nr:hypothetical protein BGZ52_001858 [Haplosporangium bisporale]